MVAVGNDVKTNNTIFNICRENNWDFIFTFKDGTLKSVWEEVYSLYPLNQKTNMQQRVICKDQKGWKKESMMFINDIRYKKHSLNWLEYTREYIDDPSSRTRFVHITNMNVQKSNAWDVSFHGRLRWKIENEGFNTQKMGATIFSTNMPGITLLPFKITTSYCKLLI